jgi:hypothetical protein
MTTAGLQRMAKMDGTERILRGVILRPLLTEWETFLQSVVPNGMKDGRLACPGRSKLILPTHPRLSQEKTGFKPVFSGGRRNAYCYLNMFLHLN